MKEKRMKLDDALKLILSKRPVVAPNQGFLIQLRKYEYELFESQKTTINH